MYQIHTVVRFPRCLCRQVGAWSTSDDYQHRPHLTADPTVQITVCEYSC